MLPQGAILLLPIDIASGVRMRLLEAWARGVAVVATPAAASGLAAEDGRDLLLAQEPEEFAAAIARLAAEPGLAERLIAGGRARLAADHSPERFAARFTSLAGELASRRGSSRSR
jgi:glycosyltransferase involved in cell wall biosynthesis